MAVRIQISLLTRLKICSFREFSLFIVVAKRNSALDDVPGLKKSLRVFGR